MTRILALIGVLFLSVNVASCGGGGGSDSRPPPPPVDNDLDWDQDNWDEKDWV